MKRNILYVSVIACMVSSMQAQTLAQQTPMPEVPAGLLTTWQQSARQQIAEASAGSLTVCDSILSRDYNGDPLQRIVNHFDAQWRMDARTLQEWNAPISTWTDAERYDYTYDERGYLSGSIYSQKQSGSTAWTPEDKQEYDHNEAGLLTGNRVYTWDGDSWFMTTDCKATYNDAGQELTNIARTYDTTSQKWFKTKTEKTYNEQGLITSYAYFSLIEDDKAFVPYFKTIYDYDARGNMTMRMSYSYDESAGQYVEGSFKETWTYDADGRLANYTYQYKSDGTELKDFVKHDYTYDGQGRLAEDLFYNKDADGQWQLSEKNAYTYNAIDSVATRTLYQQDASTKELAPAMYYEFSYDANGNLIDRISSAMGTSTWVYMARETKEFNAASKLLSTRDYNWTGVTNSDGEWQQSHYMLYTYDDAQRQTSVVEYVYEAMEQSWTGRQKSETAYDADGNLAEQVYYEWTDTDFVKTGTVSYYYSVVATGISQVSAPNAAERPVVSGGQLQVLDGGSQPTQFRAYTLSGEQICGNTRVLSVEKGQPYVVVTEGGHSFKVVAK